MAQIFRNIPLDYSRKEIRILRLLPADDDDEVHTELFAASIERDTPYFEAISYAWDLKGPRKSITVNDHQFEISESIYILLKTLQRWPRAASGMNIWIDSICINQEDISEKSAQVPLMKDIYTKASQVLIWLGDGDECADRAIETMGSVNSRPEGSVWDGIDRPALSSMSTEEVYTVDTLLTLISVLKGVNDVLGREWFRRTWTLQELQDFFTELKRTRHLAYIHDFNTINRIRHRRQEFSQDGEGLSELIRYSTHRLCTDPRDKIYGLLGMVSDTERQCLQVDYTKTLRNVFIDAFHYLISRESGFQVLSTVGETGLTGHRGWPTWLPGFDRVPSIGAEELARLNFSYLSIHYKASLGLPAQYSVVDAGDLKLLLNGIPIDEVIEARDASIYDESCGRFTIQKEVIAEIFLPANTSCKSSLIYQKGVSGRCEYPMYCPEISWSMGFSEEGNLPFSRYGEPDRNGFILSVKEHCKRIENWKSQGWKPLAEAIWRAIVGDCLEDLTDLKTIRCHIPAPASLNLLSPLYSQDCSSDESSSDHSNLQRPMVLVEVDLRARYMASNRRAFRTSNGFIGFGPKALEAGDKIVLVAGAGVPFALRPRGEYFTFIGECYVEGLMQGELFREFPEFTNKTEELSGMRLKQFVIV